MIQHRIRSALKVAGNTQFFCGLIDDSWSYVRWDDDETLEQQLMREQPTDWEKVPDPPSETAPPGAHAAPA